MARDATALRSGDGIKELTIRGIILGALITVVFTAANVYLGLKIGITFATSIPAAVISMAVLKAFRDATIQENNIVQTIASAAGTLSAIIFVLPGLIMIGYWNHFPYWLSVAVIGIGGILGVMYSVPLRRALVTGTDLPYPEGVAAAEVLKVGSGVGGAEENRRGLVLIAGSTIVAALYFLVAKTRLLTDTAARTFKVGTGGSAISASLSMALIGVGHLVGVAVGAAMVIGMLITWAFIVPHWTQDAAFAAQIGGDLETLVSAAFKQKARMVGAGTIGVAAIWTLLKIIGPIVAGIRAALIANRERKAGRGADLPLTERDIPIGIVTGTILLSMIPIGLLLYAFGNTAPIAAAPGLTIALSIIYTLIAGVVIAAVCGYMAGLIGASNSPISGVGILSVLGIALILAALFPGVSGDQTKALVAFALFVTAIIFGVATISNNNLQDLKTGQLVEATPWRQQVALVLGVVFGAIVIPPILDLMNTAFTFQGAPGAKETALAAPAGGDHLDHRPGRARRQPRLGPDPPGRDHRRGRGDRRRSAEAVFGQAAAPAAAGDRHGHLSAAGSGPADPVRRGARMVLQSLGAAVEKPGLRRAHGRPDGDRPDRRRKPDGRRLRLRGRRRGEGWVYRQRQCLRR